MGVDTELARPYHAHGVATRLGPSRSANSLGVVVHWFLGRKILTRQAHEYESITNEHCRGPHPDQAVMPSTAASPAGADVTFLVDGRS